MGPAALHSVFDALAFLGAGGVAALARRHFPALARAQAHARANGYFVALVAGAAAGAFAVGSLNISLAAGRFHPGHSLAGALAGAILAVEVYKLARGIRGSTGAVFVLPLAVGIAFGRMGCLAAGLSDETYGIPSRLPWAVDLGDGVPRHPVQLYEAAAMLAFAALATLHLRRGRDASRLFAACIGFYAAQRFLWEFLKPYPKLLGPFNLFHFVMLFLGAYATACALRRDSRLPA